MYVKEGVIASLHYDYSNNITILRLAEDITRPYFINSRLPPSYQIGTMVHLTYIISIFGRDDGQRYIAESRGLRPNSLQYRQVGSLSKVVYLKN